MPQARLRIALVLVLGVALVAALGIILRQSRQLADLRRQGEADQRALRELREALRQRDLQKTPAETEELNPLSDQRAALARRGATIEQLNRELLDAQASIAQLQAQLSSSRDEREKAFASASESHRKDQESWQSQLDALKQQLDSAEGESQASRQRITALEAENDKLKSATGEGSARAAEVGRVITDLQDLDRHRDLYLTSIMRRYRDITSQFRAMSGMLDSSRDPNSSIFSGAALLRIQNETSLAEDDLRQLNDLNAQARQLEKKLTKK
jgi:chromosome segregation ATPase